MAKGGAPSLLGTESTQRKAQACACLSLGIQEVLVELDSIVWRLDSKSIYRTVFAAIWTVYHLKRTVYPIHWKKSAAIHRITSTNPVRQDTLLPDRVLFC